MEKENKKAEELDEENINKISKIILDNRPGIASALIVVLAGGIWAYSQKSSYTIVRKDSEFYREFEKNRLAKEDFELARRAVVPAQGFELSVSWDGLGRKMMDKGVMNEDKIRKLYESRGALTDYEKRILFGSGQMDLNINSENSDVLLNALWALGLANKNEILKKGPMTDEKYDGAGKFASTGGWTLSSGKAMDHYSKYSFISLTSEQQKMVENVSKGVYRPCCGNSTHFPDCNHGMAMLGLLELMASQGFSEKEMYDVALKVNSFWFPETYINLARYYKTKNTDWNNVGSKEVLGMEYSSGSGYQNILKEITPVEQKQGGSCSV